MPVQVQSVRSVATDAQPRRPPRFSDRALRLAKTLLMVAAASTSVGFTLAREYRATETVTNEWLGHSVRCPRTWWAKVEGVNLATVVSECKNDHMEMTPRLLPRLVGVQVRIDRFDLADSKDASRFGLDDRESLAFAAARHAGLDLRFPIHGEQATLMGRRAVRVAGPRGEGWIVAIAAHDGSGVLLAQVAAPSRLDIERTGRTWRAILRSLRPAPGRGRWTTDEPAASERDPGWGSSEEGLR
jgi:hypothetical protein